MEEVNECVKERDEIKKEWNADTMETKEECVMNEVKPDLSNNGQGSDSCTNGIEHAESAPSTERKILIAKRSGDGDAAQKKKRNRRKKKKQSDNKCPDDDKQSLKRMITDDPASLDNGESLTAPENKAVETLPPKKKKKRKRKKKTNVGANQETMVIDGDEPEAKKQKTASVNNEGSGAAVLAIKKKKKRKRKKKKTVSANGGIVQSTQAGNGTVPSSSLMEVEHLNPEGGKNGSVATASSVKNKKKRKRQKKKKGTTTGAMQTGGTSNSEVTEDSQSLLNTFYSKNLEKIKEAWHEKNPLQEDNSSDLIIQPFRCYYMPNFLKDSNLLLKVKEELSRIDVLVKNNDLYKFRQTPDLKSVSSPHIATLRNFLYGDFRQWVASVTGIELNDTVDMGSSRYSYTDQLLCHDDELEGRRVAYILYLTPPWYEKDGGMLDLFDVDNNGEPKDVVKSILPKWNTFVFFEVSPVSFHQVREVLSKDKERLSINGWFHGPNIERPAKHISVPKLYTSPVHLEEEEFYAWINPSYLDSTTQKEIRKKFKNDSEIELESFLCQEKYEEVVKALELRHLKWVQTGPANKQSCKVLSQVKLPEIITSCIQFLKSEALFLILSQLTGLKLHKLAPPDSDPDDDEEMKEESSPGILLDIRQWSHGCYTLVRDSDQGKKSSLDAMLFANVANEWKLEYGGVTSYIAKDEDEELLTVMPRSNCLALVYRDAETLKFSKYINASVKELGIGASTFYDFNCNYKE